MINYTNRETGEGAAPTDDTRQEDISAGPSEELDLDKENPEEDLHRKIYTDSPEEEVENDTQNPVVRGNTQDTPEGVNPENNPENKCVIYSFAGMLGSCHDLTCMRRSGLWKRLDSAELFDLGQYLLGDNSYVPLERLVCSYKRT
ncbi:hypothetical protein R1sor_003312 [Riccia sorocarpa]|uniref:DDE Tnp4 domain-containing protein n=1 Tax=Riccia sorocarpa TaxID=122646 RepID=A0ABD3H182_9MARC